MFGLRKTLGSLFGLHPIDESWFEQLEETLLKADVGIATTNVLIASLRKLAKSHSIQNAEDLKGLLVQEISRLLAPLENPQNPLLLSQSNHKPEIWLIVGVNGAGKTTSIGKLCHHFQVQGKSVLLAAGDTFRAAARNQLKEWGERNQVVISKVVPDAPHQIVLVLDGNTGQNGIAQVLAFRNAIGLQGIIVTKLDGTAKGGVICALSKALETPPETGTPAFKTFVYALGKGEGLSDLEPFNAEAYAKELVE